MIIRRNTKAFKTIVDIVTACEGRGDRAKLIRLYITKAGHSIQDRISVEGIEEETDVFYDLTFAAVVANLGSSSHSLHVSDEVPGIYFFHSSTNKVWDENPFEFDERVVKEFSALPELPVARKREKPIKPPLQPKKLAKPEKKGAVKPAKKKHTEPGEEKAVKPEKQVVKQPAYKLREKIEFTGLDDVIFRRSDTTKREILDYYNAVADYILPWLKDRPQLIHLRSGRSKVEEYRYREALNEDIPGGLPDWISSAPVKAGKLKQQVLLCNTREHLLYYVENNCLDFYPEHARHKSPERPDYSIIGIGSEEDAFEKVVDVAHIANRIVMGLQLSCVPKTDGVSGLHLYIPLNAKSEFGMSEKLAENICRLIALKIPDQVTLKDSAAQRYRKVTLDYSLNKEQEVVIAPYSLHAASETIAVPLYWEELTKDLRPERFAPDVVLERLRKVGDPLDPFLKNSVDAKRVAERLDKDYRFLFD